MMTSSRGRRATWHVTRGGVRRRTTFVLALTAAAAAVACASGRVSNVTCEHDVRLVNGLMDYGVSVAAQVENAGDTGEITLRVALSTSEGEWSRSQTLTIDGGQTKSLSWFFPDPTINATNIQCGVKAFP